MSKKEQRSIEPLGTRILLEEVKEVAQTASGIILPDDYSEDKGMKEGKVVAVGSGKMVDGKLETPNIKKGQHVLYQWGDTIKLDGKEYYLVDEASVAAIIS